MLDLGSDHTVSLVYQPPTDPMKVYPIPNNHWPPGSLGAGHCSYSMGAG